MPRRLPYELIVAEADKLFSRIFAASSSDMVKELYEKYEAFLEAAGWNAGEFEQEAHRRVEEEWKVPPSIPAETPKPKHALN